MPSFSQTSLSRLMLAHPDLQRVLRAAIKDFDFSVICSYRSDADQQAAYDSGHSKARPGQSPHNFQPSLAVDCAPHPLDWKDIKSFQRMAQVINGHAAKLGVPISWGGSWRTFKDYPHFELANWKAMKPEPKSFEAA